jgi:polyisoprenoid-binding protein YceI
MKYLVCSALVLILFAAGPTDIDSMDAAGNVIDTPLSVSDPSIAVVCPLTVGGSFEAKTRALTGEVMLDGTQPGEVDGVLSVDLRTLQTGIGLRDTHLRENYLEVQRGDGFATAKLDRITLEGIDPASPSGKAKFRGTLKVHGTEREVTGTANIRQSDQGLRVEATFPVKVSDFEIASPSYLGVGVKDDVNVKVNFKLGPKRQL